MNSGTLRLTILGILSAVAMACAPLHYSWRRERNHRLFEQRRITKDNWAVEQGLIPAEARIIGICGAVGFLFVGWRLFVRRSM